MEIFLFKSKSKELYHAWRHPFQGNKHLTCPFMCIKLLKYHLYISVPHTSPLFRRLRFTQNNIIIKTVRSSLVLLKHFYGKKGGKLHRHTTALKKKGQRKNQSEQQQTLKNPQVALSNHVQEGRENVGISCPREFPCVLSLFWEHRGNLQEV